MALASPGAFACASLSAVGTGAEQQHAVFAQRTASRAAPDRVEPRAASSSLCEAAAAPPARERAAPWRAPSGPAPSRAPPAARS